jgi:hypothetical protein
MANREINYTKEGAVGPFFSFAYEVKRKPAHPIPKYRVAKTQVYGFALIVRFRTAPHHPKILPYPTQFNDFTGDR